MEKKSFKIKTTYSTISLEIIHMDVWGSSPVPSIHGCERYKPTVKVNL